MNKQVNSLCKLEELQVKLETLEEQMYYIQEDILSIHLEIGDTLRSTRTK